MLDPTAFENTTLLDGFTIRQLAVSSEPLLDALGREAVARTQIIGRDFYLTIRRGLSDRELSVTLYHEVLEAMTVACVEPPSSVREFNEGDFESAAYAAHDRLGVASPVNLNRMLQSYGFRER